MRVYLCGPINGRSDEDCRGWRQEAKRLLDCKVFDPMGRDYRGIESENIGEIVEGDKVEILKCNTVLVYFDRPSVGTSMEILYAWERDKSVIVVLATDRPVSPWLTYHTHRLVGGVAEACNIINGGKIR